MSIEELRAAARNGLLVQWRDVFGRVNRVAGDGAWADMEWAQNRQMRGSWRKRQPLVHLSDWQVVW